MAESWRYVDCGAVDAFENNAEMAVLSRSASDSGRSILQTSVWGRTHLNVGWFDDVDSTLDLAACERLGIQVIRRPFAGGGTAFYDAGCAVMFGLMVPKPADPGIAVDLDAQIARLQPIVLDALDRLGLGAVTFQGSADLRWINDRKLGGISAGDFGRVLSVGGFLNIRPPDLDLYLQVVRVPEGKFADKIVKDMREYVCTAEEVAGRTVTYEEFRDALVAAVEAAGIELERDPMTEVERGALAKISQRIANDDQVRRISSERFAAEHAGAGVRVGFGNHKGRKLCRAGVAIGDDGRIDAAMMAGDMHVAPPDTLDRVAEALAGADAGDEPGLRDRIAAVWDADGVHQADATMGVTTDDLLAAVAKAVADAQGTQQEGPAVELDGSKILVTGASSGIGAALAPQLAAKGATVGIVARRAERLEAVVEECRVHTPASTFWAADLGDVDAAVAIAQTAWDHFGGLDALVNNAAIGKRKLVQTLTPTDVDVTMATNFFSPVRMGMALLPRMLERGAGPDRERVEHGRAAGHPPRSRVQRVEVRALRMEREHAPRPRRDRGQGQARAARADRHRDLGAAARRAPRALRRPVRQRGRLRGRHRRGDGGRHRLRVLHARGGSGRAGARRTSSSARRSPATTSSPAWPRWADSSPRSVERFGAALRVRGRGATCRATRRGPGAAASRPRTAALRSPGRRGPPARCGRARRRR